MITQEENQWLAGPTIPRRVQLGFQLRLPAIHGDAVAPAQLDPFLLESELYRLIRSHPEQRRDRLEWDSDLQRVARLRLADMVERQYYRHTDPDGHGPNWWLRYNGVTLPNWYDHADDANNVESINNNVDIAADCLASFIGSPHHRDHLLGGSDFYRGQSRIGVGFAWGSAAVQRVWSILTLHAT